MVRKQRNRKLNEMNTEEIRQLYGTYVGSDVSDELLENLDREDMLELLIDNGYE